MVILPEKGYWCDGWTDGQLTDVDSKRRVADLRNSDWEIKREGAPMYYRMHFMNKVCGLVSAGCSGFCCLA